MAFRIDGVQLRVGPGIFDSQQRDLLVVLGDGGAGRTSALGGGRHEEQNAQDSRQEHEDCQAAWHGTLSPDERSRLFNGGQGARKHACISHEQVDIADDRLSGRSIIDVDPQVKLLLV